MKKTIFLLFIIITFHSLANKPISRMSNNLLGKGELSWLFFDVYEAKLWAPEANTLFEQPFSLELTYKMDFDGIDIVRQTVKELKHIGVDEEKIKRKTESLVSIFPNIKKGDTITANYHPEQGITFYLNLTKRLGTLEDQDFSRDFLNIWLSEGTRAPKLRKKLLGEI